MLQTIWAILETPPKQAMPKYFYIDLNDASLTPGIRHIGAYHRPWTVIFSFLVIGATWGQILFLLWVASRGHCQGKGGWGGLNLFCPTGGRAYGIPVKLVHSTRC